MIPKGGSGSPLREGGGGEKGEEQRVIIRKKVVPQFLANLREGRGKFSQASILAQRTSIPLTPLSPGKEEGRLEAPPSLRVRVLGVGKN